MMQPSRQKDKIDRLSAFPAIQGGQICIGLGRTEPCQDNRLWPCGWSKGLHADGPSNAISEAGLVHGKWGPSVNFCFGIVDFGQHPLGDLCTRGDERYDIHVHEKLQTGGIGCCANNCIQHTIRGGEVPAFLHSAPFDRMCDVGHPL